MRRLCLVAVVLTSVAAAAPLALSAAPPNLILNGGFERPVVASGSYKVFSTGQHFLGWKVVGKPGNVAPISGAFTENGFTFGAAAGKQWLDLTGLNRTATGVEQTTRTVKGTCYVLRFSVGNIVDPSGTFGTTSRVIVKLNGVQRFVVSKPINGGTAQAWQAAKFTFAAPSANTRIAFLNGDPATDNSNGLDAISVTRKALQKPCA